MRSYRRSALLASMTLALGVAVIPASAFADPAAPDPTATFGIADLRSALSAAEVPTAAQAEAGWMTEGTDAEHGASPVRMKAIYAVSRGAADIGSEATLVEAQHFGTYMTLSTLRPGRHTKQALQAIKKATATWVFMPDASLDLHDTATASAIAHLAPDLVLEQMVDPAQTTLTGAPTRTVGADGSTTYVFSENDLTSDGESGTVTMTVDSEGVLNAVAFTTASSIDTADYTYGPQQVALPDASRTVTLQQLTEGAFLATLPKQVKSAAMQLARELTRRSHRHVKVVTVRAAAKRFASYTNRLIGDKVFSVRSVLGGARITGTNRYTHSHAAYTVTTSGTKAVARKA